MTQLNKIKQNSSMYKHNELPFSTFHILLKVFYFRVHIENISKNNLCEFLLDILLYFAQTQVKMNMTFNIPYLRGIVLTNTAHKDHWLKCLIYGIFFKHLLSIGILKYVIDV